jgi:hypothetical protein
MRFRPVKFVAVFYLSDVAKGSAELPEHFAIRSKINIKS